MTVVFPSACDAKCRELGFEAVEVNASDTRNKSDNKHKDGIGGKLSNRMKELVTNRAIGAEHGRTTGVKQVLIMDEVDGMSGVAAGLCWLSLRSRSHNCTEL